ncbi:hypothetical protein [Castellaniella sp.]|uniref:hypothetical protein n=1 Tax=Castellaniella sp. TaxID=1955812 RepID=UPI002AFFB82B|nr:hypothetical protein [Castellaniella sp.]
MSTVTCTEKMTFGPSEKEVWLEIAGLEWSPRRGGHWIMSVPGGKLRVRAGHSEIKTVKQARNVLLHLIRAAEAEPDQARLEVFDAGKGPSDKSMKVRFRAGWPDANIKEEWREHTFTLPRSVIEDLGDGRLTAPVWIVSRKLKETYGYVQDGYPKLKADWPCRGIEEMFAPVLEKASRRERALNALHELIHLEDVRNTSLEELEAGLCWLQADRDDADWYQRGEEIPSEIQLQMAEHEADEAGRIAAERLLHLRDKGVQGWREGQIYSFRPFLNSSDKRALDLRESLRRLNIDEKTLQGAIAQARVHLVVGEVEDALLYLNCDDSISYMKEGSTYTPDTGLAALTKIEGLLNRELRAA